MSDITKIDQQTPNDLITFAIQNGGNVDQLEKLLDLKERYDIAESKKSFFSAMSEFQSTVPAIKKTSSVAFNTTKYSFAPLASIAEQIREPMKNCGLSYRFEQSHGDEIEVTCIVTHVDGHSEQASMKASADNSGKKNKIQAIGSAVTYLQRYTLISALGLTTADEDIDAQVALATGDVISVDQIQLIESACKDQGRNIAKLLDWVGVSKVKDIPNGWYPKIAETLKLEA